MNNRTGTLTLRRPDYSDNFISVLVGPEESKFVIHEATLRHHSKFFDAACSRDWKEGQERVVRLPEHDAEAFMVYTHSAYTSKLDMTLIFVPDERDSHPSIFGEVYVLANYLQSNTLCNLVVDYVLKGADMVPANTFFPEVLAYFFANTTHESKMRLLFLDMMSARINEAWLNKYEEECPPELLLVLAKRYVAGKTSKPPGPTYADRCKYHIHEEGKETCD